MWWRQGCNSANLDSRQSCIPSFPCHDGGASGLGPGKLCMLLPGHTPPSKISALSPNPHNHCISQLSLNNKSPQTQWPKYVPRPTRIRGVGSSVQLLMGKLGRTKSISAIYHSFAEQALKRVASQAFLLTAFEYNTCPEGGAACHSSPRGLTPAMCMRTLCSQSSYQD